MPSEYVNLRRKLYWYAVAMVAAAVFIVLVMLLLVQATGVGGDVIVRVLQFVFRIGYEDAMHIYYSYIRNNVVVFVWLAIAVCFIFLFRFLLIRIVKYFDEIIGGVDILIQDEDTPIKLSGDMAFMEKKLNTLRKTLRAREQQAKMADQRKNDLIMYLAHDIKTPLTSVIGYLSLLEEAPDMPVAQKAKYVSITLGKAYRLEKLVGEFFEIARYNHQTIALEKEKIDLYTLLAQMTDEFYPVLTARNMKAEVHAAEDLAVYGDRDKLARVFNNILKNAASYGKRGSVIRIAAGISGASVCIAFQNEGNIPKDKLTVIFEQFIRLDSARSTHTGGAGLGLAIATEIVTQHGGRIFAESEGGYTTFTVELPAQPVGADPAE